MLTWLTLPTVDSWHGDCRGNPQLPETGRMTLSSSTDPRSHSLHRFSTAELHALGSQARLGLFDMAWWSDGAATSSLPATRSSLYLCRNAARSLRHLIRQEIRTIASGCELAARSGAEAIVMACNTTNTRLGCGPERSRCSCLGTD